MGRGADLAAFQGGEAVAVVAGVGEREVAGGALVRRRGRRVLADRQHGRRQDRRLGEAVGQRRGQERHRHREVARHHRDVGPHRPYAGLGDQRDADIAARHRRRRRHALGRLPHADPVQHRVERPPGLEPDQPGDVGAEDRPARRRQHQQHRHREGADVEALEDDLQERHPGLGLPPDRPVGRDGLGLGPCLGVGAQSRGVAGLRRPLLAGVVDRVQHHLLAHDLARTSGSPYEEVVRGRQRRQQLGARQRLRPRPREDAPSEHRAGALDLRVPLRVQPRSAGLAGDDLPVDGRGPGADRRLAGGELEHARGRGARRRRARRRDQGPDVGRLPQIVGRDVAEQQRVEHALAGIVADVAREHRVGDLQPRGRGREPRPEDQPVSAVGEVVRQREGLFGEPRQAVADLAGERGEQREADGHVGHHGGRQGGVQPVHHPHRRFRHDHRAPDGDEQQHPLGVVLPRAAEGGAEQDPAEPAHARELSQRDIGAARGDGGDRVQQVDQIGAAAEGEELVHILRCHRMRQRDPAAAPPREKASAARRSAESAPASSVSIRRNFSTTASAVLKRCSPSLRCLASATLLARSPSRQLRAARRRRCRACRRVPRPCGAGR